MRNDGHEFSTNGMERNIMIVAVYIGWRTMPYRPVLMTVCSLCVSMVRESHWFSRITSAYILYPIKNEIDAMYVAIDGRAVHP